MAHWHPSPIVVQRDAYNDPWLPDNGLVNKADLLHYPIIPSVISGVTGILTDFPPLLDRIHPILRSGNLARNGIANRFFNASAQFFSALSTAFLAFSRTRALVAATSVLTASVAAETSSCFSSNRDAINSLIASLTGPWEFLIKSITSGIMASLSSRAGRLA